ncbi:MAG: DUF1444 family protein [Planctomycetota bacterium]
MWNSIAVAWTCLLLLGLWIHARRRQQQGSDHGLGEFLECLRAELRERHPDVAWCGLSAEKRTVILVVSGQETPVPLNPLFQHYLAFPSAFGRVVDRMLEEVRAEGLHEPSDHEFAKVVLEIMPQVKSAAWLREHGGAFGGSALVSRDLGPDLVVCYVIDEPWSMIFICREHLRRWHKTEQDIHQLAMSNLRRKSGSQMQSRDDSPGPVLLQTGDGYDAARILLLETAAAAGSIIALPDRDTLWIGSDESEELDAIAELARQRHARAVHPVSPELYRLADGALAKLSPSTVDL